MFASSQVCINHLESAMREEREERDRGKGEREGLREEERGEKRKERKREILLLLCLWRLKTFSKSQFPPGLSRTYN